LRVLTKRLNGAECFLRCYPVLNWSRISPHFTERYGALPHSQVTATCPCSEPDQSSSFTSSYFLKSHLNIIIPFTSGSSKWSLSVKFPHQNPVNVLPPHHTCYMLCLSYSSRFDLGYGYRFKTVIFWW